MIVASVEKQSSLISGKLEKLPKVVVSEKKYKCETVSLINKQKRCWQRKGSFSPCGPA